MLLKLLSRRRSEVDKPITIHVDVIESLFGIEASRKFKMAFGEKCGFNQRNLQRILFLTQKNPIEFVEMLPWKFTGELIDSKEENTYRFYLSKLHGQPAIEGDHVRISYHHGMPHAHDGPTSQIGNSVLFFNYGELHRIDGPAVIREDGVEIYYLNGKRVNADDFEVLANKERNKLARRNFS